MEGGGVTATHVPTVNVLSSTEALNGQRKKQETRNKQN